jgi:hypothetical protein
MISTDEIAGLVRTIALTLSDRNIQGATAGRRGGELGRSGRAFESLPDTIVLGTASRLVASTDV